MQPFFSVLSRIHSRVLSGALTAFAVAGLLVYGSTSLAQLGGLPIQEQIQLFQSLPPAQQRALIRELQRDLPPAQRETFMQLLQGEQRPGGQLTEPELDMDPSTAVDTRDERAERDRRRDRFRAGDTLVADFEFREDALTDRSDDERRRLREFRERLLDGNPYRLDSSGQLYLPGVPTIGLNGLNVVETMVRLEAEASLRIFDILVTPLPLEPMGIDALEPFGYEIFRGTPSTFAPETDIPAPVNYVVGPGDTINVQLFGNQNIEYFLTVSRDGTVNFPQIGPVNVSGLTFTEVRNVLTERVTEQMIGVRASITLGELRSIRVFVLGEVERPGSYSVSSLATITNALLTSGGVRRIGSLRNVRLMRDGEVISTLDLYELLLRGDTRNDVRLQPGDAIFVPPVGQTIAVDGEVRRPAIYELRNERTVAEIVSLAGGLMPNANRGTLKLERIVPGRGTTVQDIDLNVAGGAAVAVQDGDVLRALANLDLLEDAVRLEGNVNQPGIFQWFPGMRLRDLLPSPEMLKPMSDVNYVLIRREPQPNVSVETLSADLAAAWVQPGSAGNVLLQPRDTVYVFNLETGRRHIVAPIITQIRAQLPANQAVPVVRVGGQVRAPGDYPLNAGMRVSDLLRAGGGMTPSAYATEAELTRYAVVNGEYRETGVLTVDLAAVLAGNQGADLTLAPYDFLAIKEVPRWREQHSVQLRGELMFPGEYTIRHGETLSQVIERAGGLTDLAFPEGSIFIRRELQEREREQIQTLARRVQADLAALSLSDAGAAEALTVGQSLVEQLRDAEATGRLVIRLSDIMNGRHEADILLKDGDQLLVPERSQVVTVIGEVQSPTSHVFDGSLTRADYLASSGGLTARADARRVYVVRANGEVVTESGSRWFQRRGGGEIRPGDTVVAPIQVDRIRPLTLWGSVTQIVYNLAIAAAAVNSF